MLLEPGVARERECLLPALPCFRGVDSLLQPVVTGHEKVLNPFAHIFLHKSDGTRHHGDVTRPIRVLIADDHLLFTEALEAILSGDERIEVAGRARDGGEAVELARKLAPDIVLMDVSMPVLDGIEATREIRAAGSNAAILMLTGSNSRADVDRA